MRKLYAASALLPSGWTENVLIGIDASGHISSVQAPRTMPNGMTSCCRPFPTCTATPSSEPWPG